MKHSIIAFYLLFIFNSINAQVGTPASFGGEGISATDFSDEITDSMRQEIYSQLQSSRKNLERQGILQPQVSSLVTVSFIWPLRLAAGISDPGFYGISNYIDHNPAVPNLLQDYNCGTRTYDVSSGYNHTGTDIFSWPYPWYKMDNNHVEIIAGAPGIILYKSDGQYDRNCAFNSNNWNAVYIQHSDGTVAWYGHMKSGTLTTKLVGQSVVAGEYLGVVGSSGSSTGPHLHFEVHDASNNVLDPWNGPCNAPASLWASQQPYYGSTLNKIATCNAPPVTPTCPGTETLNQQNIFCQGSTVYVLGYYRDQQNGQSVTHKLIQPNNSVWQQWTQTFTIYYSASWWYYSRVLPNPAQTGVWKYQITYMGQVYETSFTVNAGNGTAAISPPGTVNICTGQNVTLLANTGVSYLWNTGATTQSVNVNSTGNYSVTVNNGCGNSTSSVTNVIVNSYVAAGVTIDASPSGAICQGTSVLFTATPSGGGTSPAYQWKKNNNDVGTGNSYTTNSLADQDVIKCIMTSNALCVTGNPVTSNSLTETITPPAIAGVTISSSEGDSICKGTNVNFNAVPISGGSNPSFQWMKNNVNVSSGSSSYSTNSLADGDIVKCMMTSNAPCVSGSPATSNLKIISASACSVTVNLKAFIEAFYIPGTNTMQSVVDPLGFPTLCDTVILSLADSVTHEIISSSKSVLNINGVGTFAFNGLLVKHRYFLVFRHRNTIETWSKHSILFEEDVSSYDFTAY